MDVRSNRSEGRDKKHSAALNEMIIYALKTSE